MANASVKMSEWLQYKYSVYCWGGTWWRYGWSVSVMIWCPSLDMQEQLPVPQRLIRRREIWCTTTVQIQPCALIWWYTVYDVILLFRRVIIVKGINPCFCVSTYQRYNINKKNAKTYKVYILNVCNKNIHKVLLMYKKQNTTIKLHWTK